MTYPEHPPLPPHAVPPTTPAAPPPPPATERPVIRWGMGDVVIGLVLWLVGGFIGVVVLIAMGDDTTSLTEMSLAAIAVSLVSGWLGLLGWPIVATCWKGQRSLVKDFGLAVRPIDAAWGLLGGVIALVVSIAGSVLWSVLSDQPEPTNTDFLPRHPGAPTVIALVVLVAIATPIVEELFFRGLFLRAVGRRWNLTAGVLVSSLVFGMLHVQGSTWAEAGFMVLVTAGYGAVFAVLVVRAGGRLGPAIVAHMCVNAVGVLATVLT